MPIPLRWLTGLTGARARVGVKRRAAPLARRDLAAEIDASAIPVRHVWARKLTRQPGETGQPEMTVIARVDAAERAEVAAWLATPPGAEDSLGVRTDWLFLPAAPEAVLIGVVGETADNQTPFRVNLRIAADRYRRQLEALCESGRLGLTTEPLQIGPEQQLTTRCIFVPVQTTPLRHFLRELPPPPVV